MAQRPARSPYEGARVGELNDPLLPRWFVLLAVVAVPVAIGVAIWGLVAFGPSDVPVAARRPPPRSGSTLTTDVGRMEVGELPPEEVAAPCPLLDGIQAAGTAGDRARVAEAVAALCDITLPEDLAGRLQAFGQEGGVVRFAAFEATGVDSAMDLGSEPRVILVNARFARGDTDPEWIAPLLVHDTAYLELPVGEAASELAARQAEATVCERLFVDDQRPSRACDDAAALLALADPLEALQAEGFS